MYILKLNQTLTFSISIKNVPPCLRVISRSYVYINLHIPGELITTLETKTLAMAFRAAAYKS